MDSVGTAGPQAWFLLACGQPSTRDQLEAMARRLETDLQSWNADAAGCRIDEALAQLAAKQSADTTRDSEHERILKWETDKVSISILLNAHKLTLRKLLTSCISSTASYRHVLFNGQTLVGSGDWILQDDVFSFADFAKTVRESINSNIEGLNIGSADGPSASPLRLSCAAEGQWSDVRMRHLNVQLNPSIVAQSSFDASQFITYLSKHQEELSFKGLTAGNCAVGNLDHKTKPVMYVLPAGSGASAYFGIGDFNILVDGGFQKKSVFWDLIKRLQRLDVMLLTHFDVDNSFGFHSFLDQMIQDHSSVPEIGAVLLNSGPNKFSANGPNGLEKDDELLKLSIIDESRMITDKFVKAGLHPMECASSSGLNVQPLRLYNRVGCGSLDMYVLNPVQDSREMKEFSKQWASCSQSGCFTGTNGSPISSLVSVSALLVWTPSDEKSKVTRILLPGSVSCAKLLECLNKLKGMEALKEANYTRAKNNKLDKSKTSTKPVAVKVSPSIKSAASDSRNVVEVAEKSRLSAQMTKTTAIQPKSAGVAALNGSKGKVGSASNLSKGSSSSKIESSVHTVAVSSVRNNTEKKLVEVKESKDASGKLKEAMKPTTTSKSNESAKSIKPPLTLNKDKGVAKTAPSSKEGTHAIGKETKSPSSKKPTPDIKSTSNATSKTKLEKKQPVQKEAKEENVSIVSSTPKKPSTSLPKTVPKSSAASKAAGASVSKVRKSLINSNLPPIQPCSEASNKVDIRDIPDLAESPKMENYNSNFNDSFNENAVQQNTNLNGDNVTEIPSIETRESDEAKIVAELTEASNHGKESDQFHDYLSDSAPDLVSQVRLDEGQNSETEVNDIAVPHVRDVLSKDELANLKRFEADEEEIEETGLRVDYAEENAANHALLRCELIEQTSNVGSLQSQSLREHGANEVTESQLRTFNEDSEQEVNDAVNEKTEDEWPAGDRFKEEEANLLSSKGEGDYMKKAAGKDDNEIYDGHSEISEISREDLDKSFSKELGDHQAEERIDSKLEEERDELAYFQDRQSAVNSKLKDTDYTPDDERQEDDQYQKDFVKDVVEQHGEPMDVVSDQLHGDDYSKLNTAEHKYEELDCAEEVDINNERDHENKELHDDTIKEKSKLNEQELSEGEEFDQEADAYEPHEHEHDRDSLDDHLEKVPRGDNIEQNVNDHHDADRDSLDEHDAETKVNQNSEEDKNFHDEQFADRVSQEDSDLRQGMDEPEICKEKVSQLHHDYDYDKDLLDEEIAGKKLNDDYEKNDLFEEHDDFEDKALLEKIDVHEESNQDSNQNDNASDDENNHPHPDNEEHFDEYDEYKEDHAKQKLSNTHEGNNDLDEHEAKKDLVQNLSEEPQARHDLDGDLQQEENEQFGESAADKEHDMKLKLNADHEMKDFVEELEFDTERKSAGHLIDERHVTHDIGNELHDKEREHFDELTVGEENHMKQETEVQREHESYADKEFFDELNADKDTSVKNDFEKRLTEDNQENEYSNEHSADQATHAEHDVDKGLIKYDKEQVDKDYEDEELLHKESHVEHDMDHELQGKHHVESEYFDAPTVHQERHAERVAELAHKQEQDVGKDLFDKHDSAKEFFDEHEVEGKLHDEDEAVKGFNHDLNIDPKHDDHIAEGNEFHSEYDADQQINAFIPEHHVDEDVEAKLIDKHDAEHPGEHKSEDLYGNSERELCTLVKDELFASKTYTQESMPEHSLNIESHALETADMLQDTDAEAALESLDKESERFDDRQDGELQDRYSACFDEKLGDASEAPTEDIEGEDHHDLNGNVASTDLPENLIENISEDSDEIPDKTTTNDFSNKNKERQEKCIVTSAESEVYDENRTEGNLHVEEIRFKPEESSDCNEFNVHQQTKTLLENTDKLEDKENETHRAFCDDLRDFKNSKNDEVSHDAFFDDKGFDRKETCKVFDNFGDNIGSTAYVNAEVDANLVTGTSQYAEFSDPSEKEPRAVHAHAECLEIERTQERQGDIEDESERNICKDNEISRLQQMEIDASDEEDLIQEKDGEQQGEYYFHDKNDRHEHDLIPEKQYNSLFDANVLENVHSKDSAESISCGLVDSQPNPESQNDNIQIKEAEDIFKSDSDEKMAFDMPTSIAPISTEENDKEVDTLPRQQETLTLGKDGAHDLLQHDESDDDYNSEGSLRLHEADKINCITNVIEENRENKLHSEKEALNGHGLAASSDAFSSKSNQYDQHHQHEMCDQRFIQSAGTDSDSEMDQADDVSQKFDPMSEWGQPSCLPMPDRDVSKNTVASTKMNASRTQNLSASAKSTNGKADTKTGSGTKSSETKTSAIKSTTAAETISGTKTGQTKLNGSVQKANAENLTKARKTVINSSIITPGGTTNKAPSMAATGNRSIKPSTKSQSSIFYVDLTYIPCSDGDANLIHLDFFRYIRARYYVLSCLEPDVQLLDALLLGKQAWNEPEIEVTLVPTYDSPTLRKWKSENAEDLEHLKIKIAPAASNCKIQFPDDDEFSAFKIEF